MVPGQAGHGSESLLGQSQKLRQSHITELMRNQTRVEEKAEISWREPLVKGASAAVCVVRNQPIVSIIAELTEKPPSAQRHTPKKNTILIRNLVRSVRGTIEPNRKRFTACPEQENGKRRENSPSTEEPDRNANPDCQCRRPIQVDIKRGALGSVEFFLA